MTQEFVGHKGDSDHSLLVALHSPLILYLLCPPKSPGLPLLSYRTDDLSHLVPLELLLLNQTGTSITSKKLCTGGAVFLHVRAILVQTVKKNTVFSISAYEDI